MTDLKALAEYLATEIHGEGDNLSVYGSAVQDDGRVYIEGDIDGAEFSAVLAIDEMHVLGDDND